MISDDFYGSHPLKFVYGLINWFIARARKPQLTSLIGLGINPRTDAVRQPPNTREGRFLCPPRRVSLHFWHTPAFVNRSRYFTSRPDLLSRVGGAAAVDPAQERTEMPIPTAALTTAAQRALANPAATRMLASGIQRAATTGGRAGGGTGGGHNAAASAATMAPLAAAALPSLMSAASAHGAGGNKDDRNATGNAHSPSSGIGFGRVAAAAQAFSGPGTAHGTSAASPPAKAANSGRLVPQKVSKAM